MKNKQMNEKFIKLWQEWLEDETSLFTMIHLKLFIRNLLLLDKYKTKSTTNFFFLSR